MVPDNNIAGIINMRHYFPVINDARVKLNASNKVNILFLLNR